MGKGLRGLGAYPSPIGSLVVLNSCQQMRSGATNFKVYNCEVWFSLQSFRWNNSRYNYDVFLFLIHLLVGKTAYFPLHTHEAWQPYKTCKRNHKLKLQRELANDHRERFFLAEGIILHYTNCCSPAIGVHGPSGYTYFSFSNC